MRREYRDHVGGNVDDAVVVGMHEHERLLALAQKVLLALAQKVLRAVEHLVFELHEFAVELGDFEPHDDFVEFLGLTNELVRG